MGELSSGQLFRKAWGFFPTGVTVVTFYEEGGTLHGLTANSVCSVSLDPMLVLVCVDHGARSFPIMKRTDRFVINFLTQDQVDQSNFFARSDTEGAPPFRFVKSSSGFPVLDGVLAYMDCSSYKTIEAGDHTIFVGQVEEIELIGGVPLVYFQGKYSEVTSRD